MTQAPDLLPQSSQDERARIAAGRSRRFLALSLGIAGVLLAYAVRGTDWHEVMATVRSARGEYLVLACGIATVAYYTRALRWRILLGPENRCASLTVFWATMVGCLGNTLLPARAGEFIRVVALGNRLGISKAYILATVLIERVLDILALLVVVFFTVSAQGILPDGLVVAARAVALGGLACGVLLVMTPRLATFIRSVLLWLALPGNLGSRLWDVLAQFLQGMRVIQHPSTWITIAGLTTAIWLMDAAGSMIAARSIGLSLTLAQVLFLLAVLGLASAIPSTPGYIGIYQFVAVTVLVPGGLSKGVALLYVTLLQASNLLVVALWGTLGLSQLGLRQLWFSRAGRHIKAD